MNFQSSDLILEVGDPLHSVSHTEKESDGFCVISSECASLSYRTIVTGDPERADREHRERLAALIGRLFSYYLDKNASSGKRILTVGLGNPSVASDSLGALTAEKTISDGERAFCFVPLTEAQTGLSTAATVSHAARESKADTIIAVDSLAAREPHRLGTVIQITDRGIIPGSGVSQSVGEISGNTMPCPVIAIGVPTVIRSDMLYAECGTTFVTPSDIGRLCETFSSHIAAGINSVIFGGGDWRK